MFNPNASFLPDLRNMFALTLGTSGFGADAWACCGSSFSESLPPELNIETSVSIPIWSHPNTDFERVGKFLTFDGTFSGICCEIDFLGSGSSSSSSGESSKSSLSLFSVKFTLVLQGENVRWVKAWWCRMRNLNFQLMMMKPIAVDLKDFTW